MGLIANRAQPTAWGTALQTRYYYGIRPMSWRLHCGPPAAAPSPSHDPRIRHWHSSCRSHLRPSGTVAEFRYCFRSCAFREPRRFGSAVSTQRNRSRQRSRVHSTVTAENAPIEHGSNVLQRRFARLVLAFVTTGDFVGIPVTGVCLVIWHAFSTPSSQPFTMKKCKI